jgi:hypothetical protein
MSKEHKPFNLDTFRMGYFLLYPTDGSKWGKASILKLFGKDALEKLIQEVKL